MRSSETRRSKMRLLAGGWGFKPRFSHSAARKASIGFLTHSGPRPSAPAAERAA